jgi:phytol kinase
MLQSAWDFVIFALPDPKSIMTLGPLFVLYTGLGAFLVGRLRMRRQVQTAYTRKIFHFIIFSGAGVIHLLMGLPEVVLFGIIVCFWVLYAVVRGDGFPFYEAMARPQDAPHRTFFILVPMLTTLLGGLTANILFGRTALVGYFVCGWGDAVGEPVGARWGSHRYRVPSLLRVAASRSLEGSASVWLAGTMVAFFAMWAEGMPFQAAVWVALACGTVGAVVEAVSTHGLDNLTIQVAAAGTAWLLWV